MIRMSRAKNPNRGARILTSGAQPKDFFTNKQTGLRPNEQKPPEGVMVLDLTTNNQQCNLPTVTIWEAGEWLVSMDDDEQELIKKDAYLNGKSAMFLHNVYVVSGEGTPGNYKWRAYRLPEEQAGYLEPKHPMDWPKKPGGLFPIGGTKTTTTTQSTHKLPYGIRFVCPGCGHWYDEMDLASHVNNCCPGSEGEDVTWALKCECCSSLDDTVKIKPGFPKGAAAEKAAKKDDPAPAVT